MTDVYGARCPECAGTGWACQPPRCDHPVHVVCPWCHGSGDSANPTLIEEALASRPITRLPVEWCITHSDVADIDEDSCGYFDACPDHPGQCVLVPCYIDKATG